MRKEMRSGISKADGGKPREDSTPVEDALSIELNKQESEHFVISSPHLKPAQLADLTRHAEHAYVMFHKIYKAEDLFRGGKLDHVVLKSRAQHEAYVDAFFGSREAWEKIPDWDGRGAS